MKTSVKVIIGFVIVLALGFGLYLAMRDTDTEGQTGSTASTTITYSETGFSPSTLTVTAGDTITVTNDSAEELDFKSDPHPVHTNNPELNQEDLPAGES